MKRHPSFRLKNSFVAVTAYALVANAIGSMAYSQEVEHTAASHTPTKVLRILPGGAAPREPHPLQKALEIAQDCDRYMQRHVVDYTCILVKREQVDGEMRPVEQMLVKCRHERKKDDQIVAPFSIYMKFIAPQDVVGREVLYVKGRDYGDVLVRKGGRRNPYLNWWLDPLGRMAMRGNRYPITEFGFSNLIHRLIEVIEEDLQYGECEVKYYRDAKVDDRLCLAIEVRHPVQRDHFRFCLGRIFIDNELHVPIHYESYTWPETEGGAPVMMEQYTYSKLRLNVGLTDAHYDRKNPEYEFRKD